MNKDDLWVIPSKVFYEKSSTTKLKDGREFVRLSVGPEGSESYEELRIFRDNFNILATGATVTIKKAIEQASRRVSEEHLMQPHAEIEVLKILHETQVPLSSKEIVELMKKRLEKELSKADLKPLSYGRPRWESTVRFAICQGLKKRKMIETKGKNQWIITEEGIAHLKENTKS